VEVKKIVIRAVYVYAMILKVELILVITWSRFGHEYEGLKWHEC
jgi:hypothetical protein